MNTWCARIIMAEDPREVFHSAFGVAYAGTAIMTVGLYWDDHPELMWMLVSFVWANMVWQLPILITAQIYMQQEWRKEAKTAEDEAKKALVEIGCVAQMAAAKWYYDPYHFYYNPDFYTTTGIAFVRAALYLLPLLYYFSFVVCFYDPRHAAPTAAADLSTAVLMQALIYSTPPGTLACLSSALCACIIAFRYYYLPHHSSSSSSLRLDSRP